ncbi:MAG: NAD-dependent epimerase/dehydratase family protein [archaeon]|nr:NAD-dependent epimerase/dehydratase family protein [archaeon]
MDWKNKKVLVTGARGFIGCNLSKELLKRGSEVYSISRSLEEPKKRGNLEEVIFIDGDVSKKEVWERVPKNIEYVFHFAAPSSVNLFKKEPEKCFNETFFGLYNALEFAKRNNLKKVIYPSTGNVYAGNEVPHIETVIPKPTNLYTVSKVACESLASSYSDFVNSIGLRISAGYGPGEEGKIGFGSPPFLFIRDFLNGKSPEVWGDGSQTRDFLYIDDLTKMIIKSAEADYTGIINVASGEFVNFKELLGKIKNILQSDIEPVFIPKKGNYVEKIEMDTTLNKKILGVKPISLEEGLAKFINYLKASS